MYSILQGFEKRKHKITRVNEGLRDARIVCSRPASARRKITRPRERVARAPRAPSTRARASRAPGNDERDIRIERGRHGRRRRCRNRVSCENPRTRLATAALSLGTRRKSQTPRPSSSIGGLRSRDVTAPRRRVVGRPSVGRPCVGRASRLVSFWFGKNSVPGGHLSGTGPLRRGLDRTRESRKRSAEFIRHDAHVARDRARPRAV